jgi:hypothetical protein
MPKQLYPNAKTKGSRQLGMPYILMDKSLWLVVVVLLHATAHDLCVQHLLTAFRTAVSI